jgi:hypothetical protein
MGTRSLDITSAAKNAPQIAETWDEAKVSWLALETGNPGAAYADRFLNSLEALLKTEPADVVVVDGAGAAAADAIEALRRNENYAERLILLGRPGNERAKAIADGAAPTDVEQIEKLWRAWSERYKRLSRSINSTDPLWRVDRWLLLRPGAWVEPVKDPSHRSLYHYPILDALLGENVSDGLSMLESKWNTGQYEHGRLVDRIRSCRECNSSHINYVDVCNQCRSLEIARQPCLHCFNCGHVDRQQKFAHPEGLSCPNCLTRLRHIGTDYDRPLENYQCHACHSLFIDAAVEARCLSCGFRHETDQLRAREIRPFKLSERGRLELLSGHITHTPDLTSQTRDQRLLNKEQFTNLVNWQLTVHNPRSQAAAHNTLHPALIGVRLTDGQARESSSLTLEEFDQWMERLIDGLAVSERALREKHDLIWILRPHCRGNDIAMFSEFLHEHLKAKDNGLQQIPCLRVSGCLLSDVVNDKEDAELLKARLLSELVVDQAAEE